MDVNQREMFPRLLIKGIEEFNRQEYFACHETLETLWQREKEPERLLTQAIIQFAVGYYHWQRANFQGAQRLFERGLAKIDKEKSHPLTCASPIDIQDLVDQIVSDMPNVIAGKKLSKFPVIRFL